MLSRGLAAEIIRSGNAPLHVMLNNMLFYHADAQEVKDALDIIVSRVQATQDETGELSDEDRELYKRALDLAEVYVGARDKSQACARDAAPYVHARFSAVSFTPSDAEADLSADVSDEVLTNIVVQVRQQLVRGGDRKLIDVSPKAPRR